MHRYLLPFSKIIRDFAIYRTNFIPQIHKPLHWTTPELETKYTALGVNLQDWDAVAEMVFPPIVTIEDYYRAKVGKAYHFSVITPDERRFLLDEALKHLQGVEPGAVDGERVELIVEGRSMVDVEEWQRLYDKIETNDRASQQKTACKLSVEVDSNLP